MGNHGSCIAVGNKKETIQVVCSDASVRILHKPVSAGQIMQEFPAHLVCHSHSFYIGQKTPALSPDVQLKPGNRYFILPDQFFQSPLSLVSLASLIAPQAPKVHPILATARACPLGNIGRAAVLCQPFEIEKSNGSEDLRIRVSAEFIKNLMEDGRRLKAEERHPAVVRDSTDEQHGLCNTPELRKDYAQLVKFSGQSWKPKLETISEKDSVGGYKRFMKINRTDID